MSNQISTFNFKSNSVRLEVMGDEPFFCLADVCSALNINNTTSSRFRLNEKGVHKMYTLTNGGKQELTFINEPNLYRIIFRSNKSEAVDFQNWVFEEVLPQIRKTGSYSQNNQPNPPLADIRADEEALNIIVNLFHSLNGAYEMGEKLRTSARHIAQNIDQELGGYYLYNLNYPAQNALDKARNFIQAKSDRIMFVKGMLNLLEPTANTRLTNR